MALQKSRSNVTTELGDTWRLVVRYTKQETAAPLRGFTRFLRYGVPAMTLLAVGAAFLSLALLRALQTQTGDALDGNWSFVPYLASLAACVVVAGLAAAAIGRGPKTKGADK